MMPSGTEKQIFLVTGGTNGIGLDTVKYLAAASPNNHVIIGARNLTKGEEKVKEVQASSPKGTVSVVQLDANDDASIKAAVKQIQQDYGRLDTLINNAGICPEEAGEYWPSREKLRSTFETNVFGPTILAEAVIPLLKASSAPKIINVSSVLGSTTEQAKPDSPFAPVEYLAYRMSKSALNMLTAYQYTQLKEFGVKVWGYCPGFVATDLGRDRDVRVKNGVDSSETSAQGILEIVEGKRDSEVGLFVTRYGKRYDW